MSSRGDSMEQLWILPVFLYALLKGSREGMKKAALKKNRSTEILFFYTLIGFLLILPFSAGALTLPPRYIIYAFLKAAVVCAAWLCAFTALKTMSVSLYGVMDLSRMVFSTLLGVLVLGEALTLPKVLGMALVLTGLLLVNLKKNAETLKMATIETAKESERGIVDMETLVQTNQSLIDTINEVMRIQQEGHQKRMEAEKNLAAMEQNLKEKLLSM